MRNVGRRGYLWSLLYFERLASGGGAGYGWSSRRYDCATYFELNASRHVITLRCRLGMIFLHSNSTLAMSPECGLP